MSEEHKHEHHDHKPRWELVEKLHDQIDESIDKSFKDDKLSFMEVDFALLMIKEKMAQQKMELFHLYMREQGDTEEKSDPPSKMYG